MLKRNPFWLDSAKAEAFNHGTHIFIKTNLLPPKVTVLAMPGQTIRDWDPRGRLAQVTWNKIIQEALSRIKYEYLPKAVVLMVVRSPYQLFDPINTNPEFALSAMVNCKLIPGAIPGRLLYAAVGCRNIEHGIDFYIGSPAFLSEMLQIVGNTLGDEWKSNDTLAVIHKDQAPASDLYKIPSRSMAVSRSDAARSNRMRPKATIEIKETYALFKTNIHPPQIGIPVPQTFLPFSLYSAWLREARAIWVDILREACATTAFKTIERAVALVIIRTQSPHFPPMGYDVRALMNVLVDMRLIAGDSYDRLACFVVAKHCDSGGGIDLRIGTPAFVPEMARIIPAGLMVENQGFKLKQIEVT